MKIFSNFDTKLKQKMLASREEKFPKDNILIIQRSKYYFIFRVFFPFCLGLGLAAGVYVFLGQHEWMTYARYPLALVWVIFLWFRPVHKLLKYLYDFTLIDPLGVTTYKQKGFLKSTLKEIPANRIRSIQIELNTLLENIFEYGSIDILTDFTDNMHIGEEDGESPSVIGMTYVDKPYEVKTKITDICFK